MQSIKSIAALAGRYTHFLFDQFGVLHDGKQSYEHMKKEIKSLKRSGVRVSVISNSGKRASVNAKRLNSFGFDQHMLDQVYTSGELARMKLSEWSGGKAEGKRNVYFIATDKDRSAIDGLSLTEVSRIESSDLIVIAGVGVNPKPTEFYKELFKTAVKRNVPAFCTNPDWYLLRGYGKMAAGPGQIANVYHELGGSCFFIGKPHPEIYQHIISDSGIPSDKTVCIGDSISHDIAGATSAGCASVLVRTGVHQSLTNVELRQLIQKEGCTPTYTYRHSC